VMLMEHANDAKYFEHKIENVSIYVHNTQYIIILILTLTLKFFA
jgi:hypothetical protein